ncbi:MAG: hypothetical protein ACI9RZ_001705 [Sphingobacteriales bacterium]|jgi:hypothetical protein
MLLLITPIIMGGYVIRIIARNKKILDSQIFFLSGEMKLAKEIME